MFGWACRIQERLRSCVRIAQDTMILESEIMEAFELRSEQWAATFLGI